MHKVSVIVSTYNWPEALEMVLQSLIDQQDTNFEVIVADDGSGPATAESIARMQKISPVPIKHFWQEDIGYRLSRVRNGAIAMAEGDIIVFTDGDCCLMPDFVSRHRKAAQAGCFVTGKRVFLKQRFTKFAMKNRLNFHKWPRAALFMLGLTGNCNRPFQFMRLPQSNKSLWAHENCWKKAQGCNIAAFREDILKIGGFDEAFEGHGLEDSDFVLRMIRSGIKRKNVEFDSPVLHLYHGRSIGQRHANKADNGNYFKELETDKNRFLPNKSGLMPLSATA
ncbi:glycosyltransferase family 2 protein [Thalassospira lucentensis]|uniref:glycosyltransferase family 2 protein n=1 Tax=Thalassospira lucentensis TaxID=168935 RepID=UPI003AA7AB8B